MDNTTVDPEFNLIRGSITLTVIAIVCLGIVFLIRSKIKIRLKIPSVILFILQTIFTFVVLFMITFILDVQFFDNYLWMKAENCGTCPTGLVCNLTCTPVFRFITPLATLALSIYLTHISTNRRRSRVNIIPHLRNFSDKDISAWAKKDQL